MRTRRRLALQRWLFGLACACTAVALSLRVWQGDDGRTHVALALLERPTWLVAALGVAAACWIGYAALRRRSGSHVD